MIFKKSKTVMVPLMMMMIAAWKVKMTKKTKYLIKMEDLKRKYHLLIYSYLQGATIVERNQVLVVIRFSVLNSNLTKL
jgi:hypothetical protein